MSQSGGIDPQRPKGCAFPTTNWSHIRMAAQDEGRENPALTTIVEQYLPVLHAYLMVRWRMNEDLAQDVLQSFVLDKLVVRNLLTQLEYRNVRFRTFLCTVLDNYARNWFKDANRQKRTPGGLVTLEAVVDLKSSLGDPSTYLDLLWGRKLIEDSLAEMEETCRAVAQERVWEVFVDRIVRPCFFNDEPVAHAIIADRLGFRSEAGAHEALRSGKRMFGRILRRRIRAYTNSAADSQNELDLLFSIFEGTSTPWDHDDSDAGEGQESSG